MFGPSGIEDVSEQIKKQQKATESTQRTNSYVLKQIPVCEVKQQRRLCGRSEQAGFHSYNSLIYPVRGVICDYYRVDVLGRNKRTNELSPCRSTGHAMLITNVQKPKGQRRQGVETLRITHRKKEKEHSWL